MPRPPISSCNGRCSPPVSLARAMLPYSLRDPYRLSHLQVGSLPALCPTREGLSANLNNSANVGLLDMIMPGWQDYALSHRPHVHVGLGRHRSEGGAADGRGGMGSDDGASGRDSQKAFFEEYKKLPGSSADHTVEKLGMAVKLD